MSKKKLTPPDLERCQAEKPNGANAFTCGGVPRLVRCTAKPTVIATEVRPGDDGLIGSMSLCDDCRQVMEKQMPGHATFKEIANGRVSKRGLGSVRTRSRTRARAH